MTRRSAHSARFSASLLLFALGLAPASLAAADDAGQAKAILQAAQVKTGLCLHIGCGQTGSPGLTAALAAANPGMAVHGLAFDDAGLERTRAAIAAQGLAGRALAERIALKPLPFYPDLASLVVAEDPQALAAQGISKEDLLAIVAPYGVLCLKENGRWTTTAKPRPKEMDDWGHPFHGADSNMVSQDKLVRFPIGLRWLDGLPVNINMWAACRAWVVAGARCYTLSSNEIENIENRTKKHYLGARDAFNGLPLWKINLDTSDDGAHLTWRNAGPLVADERRVYAVRGDKPIIVDGVTGTVVATCDTAYATNRLALLDGVLLTASWEGRTSTNDKVENESLWATWIPKGDKGAVEAFDAASGQKRWSQPLVALALVASGDVVYVLTHAGAPASNDAVKKDPELDRRKDWNREVVALDLKTGKERWRVAHGKLGARADLELGCAGPGFVVVTKREERGAAALSAADGSVLWQQKGGGTWTPVVDGLLWRSRKRFDPLTGADKGAWPVDPGDQGCTPSVVVNNLVTRTRGCNYEEILLEEGKPPKSRGVNYGGARGGCMEGMVPANGLFYTAQNNCRCSPAQVYGFLAIGPCTTVPTAEDFAKPRTVEKGPASVTAAPAANAAGDWACYRHDGGRSGASAVQLPATLKELWRTQVAKPGDGPLAAAWKARLAPSVTAPVSAGGLVVVASSDACAVVALDGASGKPKWSTTLGGRIDTPPTLHRGLCLVGAHDGYVYALRAQDGQQAWRLRVAPWERRLMAYGQVESVWPAVGTVVVHDGVAYANAGRTSESDGGIAVVAFDPVSGAQKWATAIGKGGQRQNDMLMVRDGALAWHMTRLDLATGAALPPAAYGKDYSQGGMMDGTWTVVGKRRSGQAFPIGKPADIADPKDPKKVTREQTCCDLLAWNQEMLVAPGFALLRAKADAMVGRVKPEDFAWKPALPGGYQYEAMALAGNAVVYAGKATAKDAKQAGILCLVALADGKKLAELPLDAAPVYDGLAIADGRVLATLLNGSVVSFGQ